MRKILFVLVLAINIIFASTANAGLVGYWDFNEGMGSTANDESGSSNIGNINGATWVEGKYGRGLYFDGVDDCVDVINGPADSLNLSTEITFMAWVKLDSLDGPKTIFNRGGTNYIFKKWDDSNLFMVYLNGISGGVGDEFFSHTEATAGVWAHIAVTYNGVDDILWHFNGNHDYGNSASGVITDSAGQSLTIGAALCSEQFFHGTLDEVRIYNTALTQEEIIEVMAGPPYLANAGPNQTVANGQLVTLDGSGSHVLSGNIAYDWTQISGPTVVLSDETIVNPTFTAPDVLLDTDLVFELVVTDVESGEVSEPDTVVITVISADPPVADAGEDVVAAGGETVMLDGSNSYDPDGIIVEYQWSRLPDGIVLCVGTQPTCETTALGRAEEIIQLRVTDDYGITATDEMMILNQRVNTQPPELSAIGDKSVYVDERLSFRFDAYDPDDFVFLKYSFDNMPDGAVITNRDGFVWTPTGAQAGTHYVTFNVYDGFYTDSEVVKITVQTYSSPRETLPHSKSSPRIMQEVEGLDL